MRRAKLIREKKGLTIFDVARETGILPTRIGRFERGENMMRYEGLLALANFYGVSTEDLIVEGKLQDAE